LRASRKTPRGHDTLEIIEVEFGCLNRHADANVMDSVVMSNVGGSLKAYGGAASISTPQRYKLSGLEAEYLSASVAASSIRTGMVLHSGSVCALMDQTVICWLVQSEDLNRLRGLLANPVEFDGRAGVALVPEELLQ
jgi:hypothetical protein